MNERKPESKESWNVGELVIAAMASAIVKRASSSSSSAIRSLSLSIALRIRSYAKVAPGTDIVSAAPNVSLQKARTWDEGISSKFSTTPLDNIFKVSSFLSHSNFQTLFSSGSITDTQIDVSGQESCHLWAPSKLTSQFLMFQN